MSQTTNTPDRTDPNHDWKGSGDVTSHDDLVAAIAHVKNWFSRELQRIQKASVPQPPAPSPVVPQTVSPDTKDDAKPKVP